MAAIARARPQLGSPTARAVDGAGLLTAVELEALYAEHAAALRQALVRLTLGQADADDLLHEVFLVALRRAKTLRAASHPKAWLYGVAVKLATAARRRARLRQFVGLDVEDRRLTLEASQQRATEEGQARVLVLATLEKLTAKRRDVFVLYELEGLTGEEIAAALGIPVKTVWTRLFHARIDFQRHLRERLAGELR